eukprot:snap_masked-scaffold_23-processed-gene-0.27-mRNA-1 protein AED:1.00 eAED:1.00 QI:0/-1/0/0/-1/1/1/0/60
MGDVGYAALSDSVDIFVERISVTQVPPPYESRGNKLSKSISFPLLRMGGTCPYDSSLKNG